MVQVYENVSILNNFHKTTWCWNQKRLERKCLRTADDTIACTVYIAPCMLPSLESLDQGRRHLQYTGTVYSDLILCFDQTGFMVESGNTTMLRFSKQLTRWFLISNWFLRWAAGSSPWHNLTAAEMANRPQSVPPFWYCMFTIRNVIFFSGDRRRWVHTIIDIYHSRWTVDVADTHPVRIANVDYLDKVIRTWVPAHISQIQCVLQPGLFWKLLMQKNLYCTDMLLHKPFIWQDNFFALQEEVKFG